MSGEPQRVFPKGFISKGGGDLIQVTNIKETTKNGAKQVHTLRKSGAGISFGPTETTVTFDAVVDENGPERNYFREIIKKQISQLRIKVPGETIAVDGASSERSQEIPLDGEIKYSITFVGKATEG